MIHAVLFVALATAAICIAAMFRQRSHRIDRDAHMLHLGAQTRSDYHCHGAE